MYVQDADISRIADTMVHSTENIVQGNDDIREVSDVNIFYVHPISDRQEINKRRAKSSKVAPL